MQKIENPEWRSRLRLTSAILSAGMKWKSSLNILRVKEGDWKSRLKVLRLNIEVDIGTAFDWVFCFHVYECTTPAVLLLITFWLAGQRFIGISTVLATGFLLVVFRFTCGHSCNSWYAAWQDKGYRFILQIELIWDWIFWCCAWPFLQWMMCCLPGQRFVLPNWTHWDRSKICPEDSPCATTSTAMVSHMNTQCAQAHADLLHAVLAKPTTSVYVCPSQKKSVC